MSSAETVSFTVRMPRPVVEQLDKIARREFTSRNHELFVAVRAYIDADKRDTNPRGKK